MTIAHGTYARFALEFLRLTKRAGAAEFDFAPFDVPHEAPARVAPRLLPVVAPD